MSNLEIFENKQFGRIRAVSIDGEPWFVGKDVAAALGYVDVNKAVACHVDKDDKKLNDKTSSSFGQRGATLISEGGLYALVLSSKLPDVKKFKKWVTGEVLPTIRKHGAYLSPEVIEKTLTSPDFIIRLATELKNEQEARIKAEAKLEKKTKQVKKLQSENVEQKKVICENEQTINELTPKAEYADHVLQSENAVLITQIAKDYGMSGSAMNKKLNKLHIIYKLGQWDGGQWVLYAEHQGKGYVESETLSALDNNRYNSRMHTRWTQKGRKFLYDELAKVGIYPLRNGNVA